MFTDARSKKVVLVTHCILNQNSISDGTAVYPGAVADVVQLLVQAGVGIVQMPCPELHCLGLDRGNVHGCAEPVIVENSRIRKALSEPSAVLAMKSIAAQTAHQIAEYRRHGFTILGLIGINRSPSCGVETTSISGEEVPGEGAFIEALRKELEERGLSVDLIGIEFTLPEAARERVRKMLFRNK